MPEYLSPGVYVEEVPSGPRPVEGVGTSTAGITGLTERGPTTPRLVTNWGDYVRWFGDILPIGNTFTPFAVRGFFANGGARLFVARVTGGGALVALLDRPTTAAGQNFRIAANGPGAWGNSLFVRIQNGSATDSGGNAVGFRVTLLYYRVAPPVPLVDPLDPASLGNANRRDPDVTEDYDDLSFNPTDGNYVLNRINNNSTLVTVSWTNPAAATARPTNLANFGQLTTQAGTNGGAANAITYIGNPAAALGARTGLTALADIDEIALLLAPDHVHTNLDAANRNQLMNALVTQCERLGDRFAVLQFVQGLNNVNGINPPRDTSYAAAYYPWVRTFDPFTRGTVLVPPSGHVAGIYARSDIERGVHKAPANEVVRDIINADISPTEGPLEFKLGKGEQDVLNPRGINVIRDFRKDRRGIRVWGARTLSSDPLWRYVNVRRLFNFVEESIEQGTQWVVFEPNDEDTWSRVRQSVSDFLTLVWR
ncbi:MAG: phage tail sheath family protein, partial [Gammaproteobacteria bacterium]